MITGKAIRINDNASEKFSPARDGGRIFVYEYFPVSKYNSKIFIISGITGINHHAEKEVIELLANGKNRVVVIHPHSTGYSEGKRGDISNFSDFINDYIEIIKSDRDYQSADHKKYYSDTIYQQQ